MLNMKGGLNVERMASSSGFEQGVCSGAVKIGVNRGCLHQISFSGFISSAAVLVSQRWAFFACANAVSLRFSPQSLRHPVLSYVRTYYQVGQKLLQFRYDSLPLSIRHVLVGPLVRFGPYSSVLNEQKWVHVTRRKLLAPNQRANRSLLKSKSTTLQYEHQLLIFPLKIMTISCTVGFCVPTQRSPF
jgi:hypothetical protein